MKRLILLVVVVLVVLWIVRDKPTVSGLIDRLTNPLLKTNAVVQESEHKRVVAEAAPAVAGDQDVPVGMVKEGMTYAEVRGLLGQADSSVEYKEEGRRLVRWDYRRAARRVVFEDGRVVSIAVR
ncbi:MAG: hypothetical protein M3S32_06340 [Acidobacteriota bacterium]|nr:hypothetical protein [Acidobacteriota bacterium]